MDAMVNSGLDEDQIHDRLVRCLSRQVLHWDERPVPSAIYLTERVAALHQSAGRVNCCADYHRGPLKPGSTSVNVSYWRAP